MPEAMANTVLGKRKSGVPFERGTPTKKAHTSRVKAIRTDNVEQESSTSTGDSAASEMVKDAELVEGESEDVQVGKSGDQSRVVELINRLNRAVSLSVVDNTSLKNKIKSLKNENKSLQEEKESLEDENESFKNEIESLKTESESLRNENESFKNKNESFKNKNESLKKTIESLIHTFVMALKMESDDETTQLIGETRSFLKTKSSFTPHRDDSPPRYRSNSITGDTGSLGSETAESSFTPHQVQTSWVISLLRTHIKDPATLRLLNSRY
ncbi:hypothetical protein M422DRAFT_66248 [Sphaerobolus stellatus SS14]|nr:hypothetical protein M422DRAFT_66248 [Sphaerobolus stellatus SS14]